MGGSKVARFFAVFHRRFTGLVVASSPSFSDPCSRDLSDDVIDRLRWAFDHSGADHIGNGADPDNHRFNRFRRFWSGAFVRIGARDIEVRWWNREPLTRAAEAIALVGKVNVWNL